VYLDVMQRGKEKGDAARGDLVISTRVPFNLNRI
jgi:hypothetical protein